MGVTLGYGTSQIFGVPVQYFCNGRTVLLALAELFVLNKILIDCIFSKAYSKLLSGCVSLTVFVGLQQHYILRCSAL